MGLDRTQDLIDLKNRIRKEVDTKLIPAEQDIEETGVIPVELLNQIRSLGLFGSHTPPKLRRTGPDNGRKLHGDRRDGPNPHRISFTHIP